MPPALNQIGSCLTGSDPSPDRSRARGSSRDRICFRSRRAPLALLAAPPRGRCMRSGGPWPSPVRLVADRLEVYGERWVPAEPSVEPGSEERDCATAVRPPRPEADQAVRTSKRSPRQRPAPRGRSKANRRTCAAPSGGPPGREDIKTRAALQLASTLRSKPRPLHASRSAGVCGWTECLWVCTEQSVSVR